MKQTLQRLKIIFYIFCVCYGIILCNLFRIQVICHKTYLDLANQQYQSTVTVPASRSAIYDRNGNFLALNKECISAYIIPSLCKNQSELNTFFSHNFPSAYERFSHQNKSQFMYVKRRLTDDEKEIILRSNLDEICFLQEENRFYPLPCAGILVGMTDIDNHGLFGIELQYDKLLAGQPTTCAIEKDARSGFSYFKKTVTHAGLSGKPITLTVDSTLQYLAYDELLQAVNQFNAVEGAAIIMNPQNGDIIAMTCYPDFNPNNAQQLDLATTKNRLITERYELGSVIKVCAALAALEEGVVSADEIIDCKGSKTTVIDGRTINTVKAHGEIPFWQVIAFSNNIGIAKVAKKVGTKMYDHYVKMGFIEPTGIGFPGEQTGYITPPQQWSKQSIISLSYGYEISITLLQLAQFFSLIANNGIMIHPRLLLEPNIQKESSNQPLYSLQAIETMKQILEKTTLEGTARRARINGYRIMSKTGTANMLIDGVYSTKQNHFTCAGIVEKDNYQRVIVVFLTAQGGNGRYASTMAVPLFEHIAEKMLIHDRIV